MLHKQVNKFALKLNNKYIYDACMLIKTCLLLIIIINLNLLDWDSIYLEL